MRLRFSLAVALALALSAGAQVYAQQAPPARLLLTPAAPLPRDGTYIANDKLAFVVDHRGNLVRLRFLDNDEIYYLSSGAASLGGRVLKYDTGDTALQVTGWGGLTLYTMQAKGGLPAEYNDAVQSVDPPPVDAAGVKGFALKLAQLLSAREDFAIGFAADWDNLAKADDLRELSCDAMRNATYALQELAKSGKRAVLSDRLHIIRIVRAAKPGVTMQKGILTIAVAPLLGPSARPSSLAIAKAMQAAL